MPGGAPLEELHAELAFEPPNDAAQRGLRDMQRLRGEPEAAGAHDGEKSAQLTRIQGHKEVL